MSPIGNNGAKSSGPIGFFVIGFSGGSNGLGKSGKILYQDVGISFSSNKIFVASMTLLSRIGHTHIFPIIRGFGILRQAASPSTQVARNIALRNLRLKV